MRAYQLPKGGAGIDALKALREGTKPSTLKNVASGDLQKKVLRQADYAKWSKDFLGGA